MIEQLAFLATVDTGDLDLNVTRLKGGDTVVVTAGLFTLDLPVAELHLVIAVIGRAISVKGNDDVAVLQIGEHDLGIGLSNDNASLWLNCAPFHMRLSIGAAHDFVAALSRARRNANEETAGAFLKERARA